MRPVLLALVAVAAALGTFAASVSAESARGPRETVDQPFTTTRPNSPTGVSYSGVYHAAGNPRGNPPYLLKMVFYPPPGMRYDTRVPSRCTASDEELELMGPDACPAGSQLGTGKAEGLFFVPFSNGTILFDHYRHQLFVMNGVNQQIVLVKSEGYTVQRGIFHPDGSIEFDSTTCFPRPPTGQCANDYIMQLNSSTSLKYVRRVNGRLRSYATTPPTCPRRRYWQTKVRFWWSTGASDTVASREPCTRPRRHG